MYYVTLTPHNSSYPETKDKLDNENRSHDVLLHLYTFGPKHGNIEAERTKAHDEVKENVYEQYGTRDVDIVNVREVRDISTTHLQYCVDISLKLDDGDDDDGAKRRKLG